ncbi:MAG: response regulator [Planctomycetes bacterium]|nr:response regulator [Planctomycetota bacterium]
MALVPATMRRHMLLLAALIVAGNRCEPVPMAITQAIVWLPTGIAIAGLWLLGVRAVWTIPVATLLGRLQVGYDASIYVPAMLGSATEALLGVWLLRRLGLRGDFASLRELSVLAVTAALAPLGSILFSLVGRTIPGNFRELPFYSGWDGWWRMNLLGTLAVVPAALLWLGARRALRRGEAVETLLAAAATVTTVVVVMVALAPSVSSVLLLITVLPIALLAAVRHGARGAATQALLATLTITAFATYGIGAFQVVPLPERHFAAQVFVTLTVAVPLVLGALIAAAEHNVHRWLHSEGLRQALVRVLPDVVYRLGSDDTLLDVMVPEGSVLPVAKERLLGRRLGDVADPQYVDHLQAQLRRARSGIPSEPVEYALRTPDHPHQREVRFVPLENGEVLGVVRDVSARRAAEEQMSWHMRALEAIASGGPLDAALLVIVQGIERFLGARAALMVTRGRRLYVACAPSLPPEYRLLADGLEMGPMSGSCGAAAHGDTLIVTRDTGCDPKWAKWREQAKAQGLIACWSLPVHAASGAVLGTFAVYHDHVHEPSAADLALLQRAAILTGLALEREQREGLLASIQANVSEGLFRIVPEVGLVHVNPACASMFGYATPTEMLREVATAGGDAQHRDSLAWLCGTETSTRLQERRLHRRDGSPFWAQVSTTVVRDPKGAIACCDGAITDITGSKELGEQLRQSQKMEAIGQLAGGVAHDFNNLLTAISGYAEAVRDGLPTGDVLRNDAGEIVRAATRAADLTRQLLAFGRRQVLTTEVVDLGAVVAGMADMLQRLLGERVQVVCRRHDTPVCARVDRAQFEQVVLNLALNARDAMPDGGRLTIATSVHDERAGPDRPPELGPGRYAVLAVQDSGCGMSLATREHAFEPFFTTKAPGKGTGLGLATVYGTVKQSGGAARIDSAVGKGTTVWVWLPLVGATLHHEPVVEVPRGPARRATILVAEDETLVRELVQRALLRAGHRVLLAKNGEEALVLAAANQIDLLVTDVVMPQLGGRELVRHLAATHPTTPVLFMSGYASDSEALVATAPGPAAILNKPFTATQLLQSVDGLLVLAAARPAANA